MKTILNNAPDVQDWKLAKNHCRTTVSKDFTENNPGDKFKLQLLISEHSPIRVINFDWSWKNIKYWVSTEWSRHKFEKFISSQRNDRQDNYDRNKAPQDSLVNFDGNANMQNLIDTWRKRLCFQATSEARELAVDFKAKLKEDGFIEESKVLVPNCVYRCGCPEFNKCRYFDEFRKFCLKNGYYIFDIENRYEAYSKMLLGKND